MAHDLIGAMMRDFTRREREMSLLRSLMVVLAWALLAGHAGAAPSQLVVVLGENDGALKPPFPTFHLRVGERMNILATGDAALEIEKARLASETLTLRLDDVPVPGLRFETKRLADKPEDGLLVSVDLARRSEDDANRKAWDDVFRRSGDYQLKARPSLAIGNGPARPVDAKRLEYIYVAEGPHVAAILGVALLLFLLAYWWLARNPTALRNDRNGVYSLGKSQMAFWGLMVLLSFVGVWVMTGTMERIPAQALVLLGISGATGLGAVVIGNSKEAKAKADLDDELRKLQAEQLALGAQFPGASAARLAQVPRDIAALAAKPASRGFLLDICSDGDGLSFHRLQTVIWTLVLGVIFVRSVAQVMSMPEFQDNLLILMGISSGTYLGFKFPEKA